MEGHLRVLSHDRNSVTFRHSIFSVRHHILSTTVYFQYCIRKTTRLIYNQHLLPNKKIKKLVVIVRNPADFQYFNIYSVLQHIRHNTPLSTRQRRRRQHPHLQPALNHNNSTPTSNLPQTATQTTTTRTPTKAQIQQRFSTPVRFPFLLNLGPKPFSSVGIEILHIT